jgi:gliding motility-associated lipoprotein GldK
MIDVKKLNYGYAWIDIETAARSAGNRRDFIVKEVVNIYPDTTVWVKDFNYSYNDPMHQDYFWHEAYADYPVVGVSWKQAKAFANWRTKKKNDYLRSSKRPSTVPQFRLPTEAEWEYAARGGLNFAVYPWGGPYTTTDRGCFLANFKPSRGDYAVDGALYTMEAKSYNPNGYGLYNMSGNVSEWTNTAYNESSYYFGATMNPNVEDAKNNRKVIRGGSWKDVAYFLQVSSRDFEYGDSARSYIGFRTVHDYLGTTLTGKNTKTKKTK